jgi:hypothetical protein
MKLEEPIAHQKFHEDFDLLILLYPKFLLYPEALAGNFIPNL